MLSPASFRNPIEHRRRTFRWRTVQKLDKVPDAYYFRGCARQVRADVYFANPALRYAAGAAAADNIRGKTREVLIRKRGSHGFRRNE